MLYIGIVLIGVCAIGFLLAVHLWFWKHYFRPDESGVDQVHFARTQDGWRLALHRYVGSGEHATQPIVLCHGLGANRFTFDIAKNVSLARYLRRRGWDVWCLELRGAGMSRPPGRHDSWTLQDHFDRDLPSAIEYVCAATGAPAVHWVGHSLGGIAMYAFAQTRGAKRVRSITTLGSPAFYEPSYTLQSIVRVQRVVSFLPLIRLRLLARTLAPFYVALRLKLVAINGATVDGHVVRRALTWLVTDVSGPVIQQLSRLVETNTFTLDNRDFQAGLTGLRTPLMVIAGDADPLASPRELKRIIETVGSDERRFHVLGRRFGASDDYGHGDLLLGRHARAECFPLVAEWLEERATDALPPPMPETLLVDDTDESPLAPRPFGATEDESDDDPLPVHSAIPGPFGLLSRYSPFRRRRWLKERAEFRTEELRAWEAASVGIAPGSSKLSMRAAQLRTRNVRKQLFTDPFVEDDPEALDEDLEAEVGAPEAADVETPVENATDAQRPAG